MKPALFYRCLLVVIMMSSLQCQRKSTIERVYEGSSLIDNNGADPWIYQDGDHYYYTKTTNDDITLWRSKSLSTVASGETQVVLHRPPEFASLWAPELHQLDGIWYIYFAAHKIGESHRMYALVNEALDPFLGTWRLEPIVGMDDTFAIDGTLLDLGERRYFIWSGWEGYENIAQHIYIASMVSPTEINKEKILISSPELAWERVQEGLPLPLVNEGPQVIIKNRTINLLYSANGAWDNEYRLGLLVADMDADLLNPQSWKKEPEPILEKSATIFGPGHNGFARSLDGQEDWLIFHTARWDHAGFIRSVRIQPIVWSDHDTIAPMVLLDDDQLQPLPSGEESRLRLGATSGKLVGDLTVEADLNAWSKEVIAGFESREDHLLLDVTIPESGLYTIIIYLKTEAPFLPEAHFYLNAEINQQKIGFEGYPSAYYQPLQQRVALRKGKDQLRLSSEFGVDRLFIDRVEFQLSH